MYTAVVLPPRLFVLPTVPSEVGPVATLPAKEESVLPRAKPIPVPKVAYAGRVTLCAVRCGASSAVAVGPID